MRYYYLQRVQHAVLLPAMCSSLAALLVSRDEFTRYGASRNDQRVTRINAPLREFVKFVLFQLDIRDDGKWFRLEDMELVVINDTFPD